VGRPSQRRGSRVPRLRRPLADAHDVHGPDGLQAVIDNTRGTLRELMYVVEVGPFMEGDMLAARWIATGSAKDGPVRYTGNDILRVANGRVVEYWAGTSPA